MKVAHLIMAYKNPAQLERMIKAMDHPDFYFFIHLDKKISIDQFIYLKELDRVKFINTRVLCNWGGFSFVNAILTSLEEILSTQPRFDFYNLMSAQDYPIKPITEIYNFYKENVGKSFVSYREDGDQSWWAHAVTRFEMYHFTDLSFKGRYFIQALLNKFLPKRKFPVPLKLYGSSISSWWSISHEAAKYYVDYMNQNSKLKDFMKYTWGADEFLAATVLMNSKINNQIVNNNLRFITWQDGLANPRVLISADFEAIKKSDKLFARKFDDTIDSKILDLIDQENLK
ncbi:beta-1,6-N-acetylglucosaminyltransferase [Pedobacter paludis]|uniref:Peptide O-xylosyltransferase n=1 Tax=Pedobacter paludis TaxID=2203212 RepID=A0A317F867_9SPHI|nr:beta-1,6-N-acetylglucosaminyltransferase [Pedobacter paludis]PWS33766.1 glycosyltransferase [Pedobacter paludis]